MTDPKPARSPSTDTEQGADPAAALPVETDGSEPSPVAPTSSSPPAKFAPLPVRISVSVSGLLLLFGFFMPWLDLGEITSISGLQLVMMAVLPGWQRVLLAACPFLALGLVAFAARGVRFTALIALGAGAAVLSYGTLTAAYYLLQTIDTGLWMVMGGSLLALGTGVVSVLHGRRK